MIPDHYATLGVAPTASAAAIRAAYLALMREYHPDRNPDPAAIERAQAAIVAFKVLGDFDRRNHYDWDRRREREAAAGLAAKGPRRVRAGAIGVGAIGLAAAAAWVLMPSPVPEPVVTEPKVAEARETPMAAKATPKREVKRVAVAAPVKVKVERRKPVAAVEPRAQPARVAKAEPVRSKPRVEPAPPKAPPTSTARVAAVVPVKAIRTPAPRVAPPPESPPPRPAKAATKPARQAAKPAIDLASLDQFVMSFYGQSWRYGDAPKRAALVQSRADFVVRRGACAADACKREAYLKLMRDVSEIVEAGQPKTR